MVIVNDTTLIPVRNMVNHKVIYVIPEEHRRVVFEAFQQRNIRAGELRALNYTTGGSILLKNYLCVKSNDLREEFNIPSDQVEYDWTLEDIKRVLTDLSSPIEELEDALDFAPDGIREMIVDYAVTWKIPDANRRRTVSRMAGVNIDKMIEMTEALEADSNEESEQTVRRRLSKSEPKKSGRRLA